MSEVSASPTDGIPDALREPLDALQSGLGDRLVSVVLFGSRARGDASPDSDWDLLLVAEELPERPFRRHVFLRRLLSPRTKASVSILARTPAELEGRRSSLLLDIALDGQVLYDPTGYAAGRLAALRRALEEAGLYRERTDAGMSWRWKSRPKAPVRLEWTGRVGND